MQKKMPALMMALVLILSLIGCGGSSQPVNGEAVESTESTDSDTETETSEEATTKTENKDIVDGEVPSGDKPVEPTASPTAEPIVTEKPAESNAEPTPEPTSTPTPHVHEYTEKVTKQATCAEVGTKTLVFACCDSKTETIPAIGTHNWVEEMETVVIPSTGHVVTTEQQVQVGTTKRTEYECAYCGARFDSPEAEDEHQKSYISEGNIDHVFARTIAWDYEEPMYETQTVSEWIIDTPETTSVVGTGRFTCSVCGATK